jgi:hypothetical protein
MEVRMTRDDVLEETRRQLRELGHGLENDPAEVERQAESVRRGMIADAEKARDEAQAAADAAITQEQREIEEGRARRAQERADALRSLPPL